MNNKLRSDAEKIVTEAILAVSPAEAVKQALKGKHYKGRIFLIAVGKAAWKMAQAAVESLQQEITCGMVITKYHHVLEPIEGVCCMEAGHPVPDENTFSATRRVLEITKELSPTDTVLFLLSGGGSALFEQPLIEPEELKLITEHLLRCGADIVEINTIRKRLSAVKGGRFAKWCEPAHVETIVLSDIVGDPLDMIASGPTVADLSTFEDAMAIVKKYDLVLSEKALACLYKETPKQLTNVNIKIIGSVGELCKAAAQKSRMLGYEPVILTDCLSCEAKDAGIFLANILKSHAKERKKMAFIAGGETVVHVTGNGLGGRNQELVLSAAKELAGIHHGAIISIGSDGTDGPTDAAGGYVDGDSYDKIESEGLVYDEELRNHNAYYALMACDGLIMTGPTGTNVNDVTIALLDNKGTHVDNFSLE